MLHLALFLLPTGMLAQYGGGSGRGDGMAIYQPTPIASNIFSGGAGRGDLAVVFQSTPIASNIFSGGNGRGDVAALFQSAPIASNIFSGGIGRGDIAALFQPTPIASNIFSGGNGRGDVALVFAPPSLNVVIALRGVLEGPYNSGTGLMGDALRIFQVIPGTEPYSTLGYAHVGGGGETVAPAVLETTLSNAIVDWVIVELRNAATPATVAGTRSALIQRDGDVVDTDGVSPVTFNLLGGSYHVTLRHRNHLGVMTLAPVALNAAPTSIDFGLASTMTYGTEARKSLSGTFPAMALWAGDTDFSSELKYTGSNNDRDPILVAIGGILPTNTLNLVYRQEDVNMNGVVKYTGTNNDRDPILVNIGGTIPTNTRTAQLP